MRVIRHKSLAQRKVKRLASLAVGGVILSLAAYGFTRLSPTNPNNTYFLIGGFLSLTLAGYAAKELQPWLIGDLGEKKTLRALEALSDEYSAVANFVIPGTEQGDIDLIVFGPHGALVVECKDYDARYACDGDEWVNIKENGYRKKMKSPSRQARRNAKALEKHLRSLGTPMRVECVIVMPRGSRVEVCNPTVPVLTRDRLLEYVRFLPAAIAGGVEMLDVSARMPKDTCAEPFESPRH